MPGNIKPPWKDKKRLARLGRLHRLIKTGKLQPETKQEHRASLRHNILAAPSGGFDLVTHSDYVLKHFSTRTEAEEYYAYHCRNE